MSRIRIKLNSGLLKFQTVRDGESTAALELPGGDFEYELSGDFTLETVEKLVSVEIISGANAIGGRYTYIDPYGDLKYGDIVKAPFGAGNRLFTARVVAEDAEKPRGLYLKTIAARASFEDA